MRHPARLLLPLLVLGCDPASDPGDTDTGGVDTDAFAPTPATPPVLFRGMHLSPDLATGCDLDGDFGTTEDQYAACVALFVGTGQVPLSASAFPFGASSGFLPMPITGGQTLQIVDWNAWQAAPASGNVAENRVASISVALTPGTTQTVVLYGARLTGNTGSRIVAESLAPPTEGEALIRVFHGAFGAAQASPDVALGGAPIAEGATYGTFSTGVEVGPGADQALTIDLDGDEVPDLVALITLEADTAYDLMLVNVPPSTVPSGFLGMLHTRTSEEPVLVPFGPATPPT